MASNKLLKQQTQNCTKKIVLQIDNLTISNPKDVAISLGKFFANISSNNNYSETFLLHKVEEEFQPITFLPSSDESYNKNFTLKDLKNALNSCKNTSPGEDEIVYEMIKKCQKHN